MNKIDNLIGTEASRVFTTKDKLSKDCKRLIEHANKQGRHVWIHLISINQTDDYIESGEIELVAYYEFGLEGRISRLQKEGG